MSRLPRDVVFEIIDWLAVASPNSLFDCVLVSREWRTQATYHLARIYRHPLITTMDELYFYLNWVRQYPRLGHYAVSLEISPDPNGNGGAASYIPFHHLSSSILPNVSRLVLGRTLHWEDYPPLYLNAIIRPLFVRVTTLELSCPMKSVEHLFRVVGSFNHLDALSVILPDPITHDADHVQHRVRRRFRATFKEPLRTLQISVCNSTNSCSPQSSLTFAPVKYLRVSLGRMPRLNHLSLHLNLFGVSYHAIMYVISRFTELPKYEL